MIVVVQNKIKIRISSYNQKLMMKIITVFYRDSFSYQKSDVTPGHRHAREVCMLIIFIYINGHF